MACAVAMRSVFVSMHLSPFFSPSQLISASFRHLYSAHHNFGIRVSRAYDVVPFRLRCSQAETPSPDDQEPPQEVILKAITEVSKTDGRVAQTTNLVIGGTVADDSASEWLALDQKVNSYPTVREFTAIGTGGDDFAQAMVVAVETVLQKSIPEGRVTQKLSSKGKYVSVNIGPIQVVSSEQVQAIYNAMRRDDRMKYFL
ncbi:hypothetical protein ZOSMA_105G00390 [Zostera marina]|uniref:Phosphoribosylformylglycinamidine synthase n=1 Tax=Zostera marina TaxID=29655 RepID=A0A0K9Q4W7_ZOSMR|nr:hypothetical protein ZOSMA_105G00390 [Zostera marina]